MPPTIWRDVPHSVLHYFLLRIWAWGLYLKVPKETWIKTLVYPGTQVVKWNSTGSPNSWVTDQKSYVFAKHLKEQNYWL